MAMLGGIAILYLPFKLAQASGYRRTALQRDEEHEIEKANR
jgi:hypothetical protein